ncbi:MAG TPA: class I SAM-dependent methyltransferase family protein [Gemmatimonadaceae bacterium]|nr:class I SAM-dependent methyltransferase family protein [Gemmatimonadaceae bacterium]
MPMSLDAGSGYMTPPAGMTRRKLANRTRVSESIPRRLVREGKFHLLPVYALLRMSDLAREGIENSGSFRFADHIYRGEPSGRYGIGVLLDSVVLRLRGARSMRSRFFHSQAEVMAALTKQYAAAREHTVVSVPSGICRDLYHVADSLLSDEPDIYARTRFVAIDLDPAPLELSRALTRDHPNFSFVEADALQAGALPRDVDVIVSLGFGEFLPNETLRGFYATCHASLRPGGVFITSAMSRDRISDYLARELAELHTHYRSADDIRALLRSAGFEWARTKRDEVGLQTLAVAGKDSGAGPASRTSDGSHT